MKNEPDWKSVAEKLLWYNFISKPHEKSGWCIMDEEDEYTIERGYHKGDVVQGLTFCSFIHPTYYHELTWKDLMWEWGIMKDHIMSDTHDCSKCSEHDTCKAFFKDDKEHEQCSWWQNHVDNSLHFESDYEN